MDAMMRIIAPAREGVPELAVDINPISPRFGWLFARESFTVATSLTDDTPKQIKEWVAITSLLPVLGEVQEARRPVAGAPRLLGGSEKKGN